MTFYIFYGGSWGGDEGNHTPFRWCFLSTHNMYVPNITVYPEWGWIFNTRSIPKSNIQTSRGFNEFFKSVLFKDLFIFLSQIFPIPGLIFKIVF